MTEHEMTISRPICLKKLQIKTCSPPDDDSEKRQVEIRQTVIDEMETDDDELYNTKLQVKPKITQPLSW